MACHVLVNARMTRAILVATFLAATATAASAGPYASLGVGNTGVDDSTSDATAFKENSRSLRVAGGYRFSPFIGIEGGLIGYSATSARIPYDGREFFVAGRGSYPLGQGFEAFGRLGLQHSSLSPDNQATFAGNGYILGAGFDYNLAALGPASFLARTEIWVDYNRNSAGLTPDSNPNAKARDVTASMWTLGVTVGF